MEHEREDSPDKLLELYGIEDHDLEKIRAHGKLVLPRINRAISRFYNWLRIQPEWHMLTDPDTLRRVQAEQITYWKQFFEARVDAHYIADRRRLGRMHARIGLSLPAYFAAMNRMLAIFISDLFSSRKATESSIEIAIDHHVNHLAVTRLMHLDTALVVEAYNEIINQTLTEQSRALMAMSTPVTALWTDILMLPVVGIVDSRRAQDIMQAMLTKIAETRSKVIILDISGVAVVDTAVANHLLKITKATRLLGCTCTLSGISPAIAQTMVELGIDVGEIRTTSTLQDALIDGFRQIGSRPDISV